MQIGFGCSHTQLNSSIPASSKAENDEAITLSTKGDTGDAKDKLSNPEAIVLYQSDNYSKGNDYGDAVSENYL